MRYTVLVCLALIIPATASAGRNWQLFEESYDITSEDLVVDIDIDYGKVNLRSSGSARACRVSVECDRELYDIDVRHERGKQTLAIDVNRDDWPFNDKHGDHDFAEITIELPERPYLDIETDIRAGEIDFRLGGLAIERFDLDSTAGETTIDFDRPNRAEMDELRFHLMVGESKVFNLGNARFHNAVINSGIGALKVDFSGSALDRCDARLDLDIGETNVTVPKDLGVRMRYSKFLFLTDVEINGGFYSRGGWYYTDSYDEKGRKGLTLDISSGIGELRVDAR